VAECGEATQTDPGALGANETTRRDAIIRAHTWKLELGLAVAVLVPLGLLIPLGPSLAKTFWFDEQWRAYYIAYHGNWWQALTRDNAPFAAGWYFLERVVALTLGASQLGLRLTTAGWWPVLSGLLFLLAARFVRPQLALVVALLGSVTPGLVPYVVQLKPFVVDSACAVAALYFFLLAQSPTVRERPHGTTLRLLAYLGVAAASCFSLAAVLVAGPLLLVDATLALARREVGSRLLGAIGAGVIALVELGVFVLRQDALTRSPYWTAQFMPHAGPGSQLSFIGSGVAGFLANTFSPSATVVFGAAALPPHVSVLAGIWSLALLIGAVVAARSREGRWLLVAILGSFLVALGASYFHYWPFGFVRPNLFELPLLVLLSGLGAASGGRQALLALRRSLTHGAASYRAQLAGLAAVLLLVAMAGAAAQAARHEAEAYAALADTQLSLGYGAAIPEAVALVRRSAEPGAAIVVVGSMAIPGWAFYLFEFNGRVGKVGRAIPPSHVLFVTNHSYRRIVAFLAAERPSELYLYVPIGTTGQELGRDLSQAASAGYCGTREGYSIPASGLLTRVTPSSRCRSA
jgi:hypothetical protein